MFERSEALNRRIAERDRIIGDGPFIGKSFGRLTVIRYLGLAGGCGPKIYLCRCACGLHERFDRTSIIGYEALFGTHFIPECRHCKDVRHTYGAGEERPADVTEEESMGWLLREPSDGSDMWRDTSVPAGWGARKRSKKLKKKRSAKVTRTKKAPRPLVNLPWTRRPKETKRKGSKIDAN